MFTTEIQIRIRVLDTTGSPASATELRGIVRNFEGAQVDTLTLDDLTETAVGVYEVPAYDVSDSTKFPGTELTVFWCVSDEDRSPEEAYQRYPLFSPVGVSGNTRLLNWCPTVDSKVYGYVLERKLPGELEFSEYGRNVFPYFFDQGTYDNQYQFEMASFRASPLRWTLMDPTVESEGSLEDPEAEGEDNYEEPTPQSDGKYTEVNRIVNDKAYCEVFGEILDVIGTGSAESIYFYVHEVDAPQASGRSLFMRRNEIGVTPNTRGQFSIPLVQQSLITAEIPAAGLIRRFIVPSKPRVNFKDLEFYPIETHRAQ